MTRKSRPIPGEFQCRSCGRAKQLHQRSATHPGYCGGCAQSMSERKAREAK